MEKEFEMVVPATDNAGNRIKTEVLEHIAQRMARHFGGVTVLPSAAGCWVDDQKLMCDQNIILKSDRYGPDASQSVIANDKSFMDHLGHEVAGSLGQKAIFEQQLSGVQTQELSGKYRVALPARKINPNAPRRNTSEVFGDLIP